MELERYRFTKDVFFSRDPFSRSTVFLFFLGGESVDCFFWGDRFGYTHSSWSKHVKAVS